ncbi:MAG: AAA family ATPase [Bacteroidia bacterium]|nr:AAA family ATPase [Bacteroidia bacterium]
MRIEIQHVGPLRDVQLDVRDLNIFIGPQASGKSTIAKVVWFAKRIKEVLSRVVSELLSKQFISDKSFIQQFRNAVYSELQSIFGNASFSRQFQSGESRIHIHLSDLMLIDITNASPLVHLSESFEEKLREVYEVFREIEPIHNDRKITLDEYKKLMATRKNIPDIKPLINGIFDDARIAGFIPEGKATLALINFNKEVEVFSNLIPYFVFNFQTISTDDQILQDNYQIRETVMHILQSAASATQGIMSNNHLAIKPGMAIPVDQLSSGQRETYHLIRYLLELLQNRTRAFLVIEEPEAHLFPEGQRRMTELLAYFVNQPGWPNQRNEESNQLLLTTHSPYILSAFNNLLYAWQVGQQQPDETAALIPRELWIDPARVGAYYVDGGTIRSIMDEELQQIRAEEIDGASARINETYDALFNLQHAPTP